MLTLRKKLMIGLGLLLMVVICFGVQSISIIQELGKSIDVILKENYRSVVACQNMKEALERMDSGVLFSILGDRGQGQKTFTENKKKFDEALQIELDNITLPQEGEKSHQLKKLYSQYHQLAQKNFNINLLAIERRNTYFNLLLPLFQQIKNIAEEILQMNQHNMIQAKSIAYQKSAAAERHTLWLVLAVGVGAMIILWITSQWIILPIQRLTRSAQEIEKGNFDLVVSVASQDEMGELAEAFNSMAAHLREYRRGDRAKLERVQQATQRAIESLPDAIAVISPEGIIDIANQAAIRLFNLSPGKSSLEFRKDWMRELMNHARQGKPYRPETYDKSVQVFDGGLEKFFLPQAIPMQNQEHLMIGILLVLSDVTGLRKMDEAKSGLISTVSHELKTPLTSIRMGLHLLLEEKLAALSPEQTDLLVTLREDAERLYRIIENILDISKMESGKIQMKMQKMLPLNIIQEAISPMETAFQDKRIVVQLDAPAELAEVWADPSRIHLVMTNLLSNALKFTPSGGEISIQATEKNNQIIFSVQDTGIGIPTQYRARVFEKFFRVPGQKAETGAGLGLAIAKEVVEAHGGTLYCESNEGKGSTFIFTLKTRGPDDDGQAQ